MLCKMLDGCRTSGNARPEKDKSQGFMVLSFVGMRQARNSKNVRGANNNARGG